MTSTPSAATTPSRRAARARRLARAAAALAAAAMLGSACVGSDAPDPLAADPSVPVGGTLRVVAPQPGAVDPHDAYEPVGEMIARTMCDTLVVVDPESGEVRPGLAESWVVYDDGSGITFRLREGAEFSDGTPVTAEDVVASLNRAASPAFAGRSAELLRAVHGFFAFRGEEESKDDLDRERLRGVRALTEQSVEIRFTFPQADSITLFSHPVTAPVAASVTGAPDAGAAVAPVCSGPYRLTGRWRPGDPVVVLERVEGYDARSPVSSRGGAGYADRIEVHAAPADGVDADVVLPAPDAAPAAGFTRSTAPGRGIELVALPHGSSSPFRSVELRRALSLAVDRTAAAAAAAPHRRMPARGFLPPTVVGTARDAACGELAPAEPDAEAARAALAGAGIDPAAQRLTFTVNDDGPNRAVAEAVAASWREGLGLDVTVEAVAFEELLAKTSGAGGMTGPFRLSWAAVTPSADAYLWPLFHSLATPVANLGAWVDAPYDRLLDREARQAGDEGDRRLLHRRLEDRLCSEMPGIPLLFDVEAVDLRDGRVVAAGGRPLDPTTALPALREIGVRPADPS